MKRTFTTVAICVVLFLLVVHGMRGQPTGSSELRPHLEHMLAAAMLIQKTPSIQQRERIYCRSQVLAFPLLPQLGTVEEVESDYVQFSAREVATQAEQIKRQYALQVKREKLAQAYVNMQTCIDLFANGWKAFPTNEREGEFAEGVRAAIFAIDHPDQPAIATTQVKPSKESDREPIRVYKIEAEYSEQARRANWQGDIDVTINIDENGKVTRVTVLNSPGMGMAGKVIQAVGQWRFKPKIKDGVPVPCTVNARVNFRRL